MAGHSADCFGDCPDQHKMKSAKSMSRKGIKSINRIVVVIPAYNEGKAVGKVVKDLCRHGYSDVVVVDDGSRDNTSVIAENAGAMVLRHVINRGQGAGLNTGIQYALEIGADAIITFDADGQHRVQDIKALLRPLRSGKADVVLGSRFMGRSKVPLLKAMALKAGALFNWIVYGIRLSDAHNGLRALSRKAAMRIEITADKMEHASEILDEIRKKELRFVEVPVRIKYTDYSMQKGQGPWRFIPLGFRIILRKLIKII